MREHLEHTNTHTHTKKKTFDLLHPYVLTNCNEGDLARNSISSNYVDCLSASTYILNEKVAPENEKTLALSVWIYQLLYYV